MNWNRTLRCLSGVVVVAQVPAIAWSQTPTPRIEVVRLDAATTVLMPSERSSNTIVWDGPDGVVIVDDMADTMAAELDQALGVEIWVRP